MRKTRILAALLCIMMIVCALPVLQASAAAGDTYASIDAILGFRTGVDSSLSYNFVNGLTKPDASTVGLYKSDTHNGTVNYGANGMEYVSEDNTIWYTKFASANPLKLSANAVVTTFKFNSTSEKLNIQFNHPTISGARTYSDISATTITGTGGDPSKDPDSNGNYTSKTNVGNSASYNFGTDWNDLMYVLHEGGYNIYARKTDAADQSWTHLLDVTGYRFGSTSGHFSLSSTAGTDDVYIRSVITYGRKKVFDSVEDVANSAVYNGYHHVMTTGYDHPEAKYLTGDSFATGTYTADGLELGVDTRSTIWYLTGTNPWYTENITVVKGKFGSSTDAYELQAKCPGYDDSTNKYRLYLSVTPTSIRTTGSGGGTSFSVNFPIGEWYELMVHNKTTGHDIYVKQNGKWTLIGNVEGYRTGGPASGDFCLAGHSDATGGVVFQSVDVYKPASRAYNSVDEILGGATGSSFAFDFNEDFSFAITPGRTGFVVADGTVVSADGLNMSDVTDTTSANNNGGVNFKPFGNWSPLNASDNYSTGYEPQAVYMLSKGAVNLQMGAPTANRYGRAYIDITAAGRVAPWADAGTKIDGANIDVRNEWVETLIVPNGTDATDVAGGYTVYAKSDIATGGKWVMVATMNAYKNSESRYSNTGIQFANVKGHVKQIKTLAINRSASDAETIPAGADYLYFNEEFDAAPAYINKSFQTVSYVDGDAVLACNDETGNSKVIVNGLEIPVGGYAEFKVRAGGKVQYAFYDGAKYVTIMQQSDYGSVTGSVGYSATGTGTWKTWRVKRTADGYTIYGKSEGDSGWYVHTADAGADSTSKAQSNFVFNKRNDGGDGDTQLSYLKVYGPAPTGAVTLTDGYNTKVVSDGETLSYAASLRAIVNEDAGKLLVVSYKGDDMLKAQIVDVADMVDDSVIVNAAATDATKIKVFLWDNFSGLNRMTPAVTLNL